MGKLKDEAVDTYEEGRDGGPCRYDGDYWSALLQAADKDIKASQEASEARKDGEDAPF